MLRFNGTGLEHSMQASPSEAPMSNTTPKVARKLVAPELASRWATAWVLAGCILAPSLASAQSEVVEYYATDALGSIRVVFDAAGNPTARSDYLPFGEALATSGSLPAQRFTGQERDGETSQDHYNARNYAPRVGRFWRCDPAAGDTKRPQTWNRYAYVLNNPLAYTDPTGKNAERDPDDVDGSLDWWWHFPPGASGGGGGGNEASGGGPPSDALPGKDLVALDTIIESMTTGPEPSEDCQKNVLDPLHVNWSDFQAYLSQGHTATNLLTTQATFASLYSNPGVSGNPKLQVPLPLYVKRKEVIERRQINAMTSQAAATFTTYVRPGSLTASNAYALVLHEALHGYGGTLPGPGSHLQDDALQRAFFGVDGKGNPKSGDITAFIDKHCKRP
jgi:RHS repeat-associated protein